MDRASHRPKGDVDRMRRLGMRPVDFVRTAERGRASGAAAGRASMGAEFASRRGTRRKTVADFLRTFVVLRRAWR
jgi:hypothetical protein